MTAPGARTVVSPAPDHPPVGRLIAVATLLTVAGTGGFTAWAALAPLASAAVAPGTVVVDSNRKTVRHRDGGVIASILVRDGDRVGAGQELVRLDDLDTRSSMEVLEGQVQALLAKEARLTAERDGREMVSFRQIADGDAALTEIAAGQIQILVSRRDEIESRIAVIRQRIAQSRAQIAAFDAQWRAGQDQIPLLAEEIASIDELLRKGLERKPRLLALKRQEAELRGRQGDLVNRMAEAREAIAAAEMEILSLRADRRAEIVTELRDVQAQRRELEEKLSAAQVRQTRQVVTAPENGVIMGLRHFAPGAVVEPGGVILDLIPSDDPLTIDARVSPIDIDVVHAGLPAKVALTALKSRVTPQLDGRVARVSADSFTDEHTGRPYYLVRVVVETEQLRRLGLPPLHPGMPTDTYIVTGEHTLLAYLTQPLVDSFRRAFRED